MCVYIYKLCFRELIIVDKCVLHTCSAKDYLLDYIDAIE